MHTDTDQTISEFTPFETAHFAGPRPGRTLSPGSHQMVDDLMFSSAAADNTNEQVHRLSQMPDGMQPKDELLFAPAIDPRLKISSPFRVQIVRSNDGISAHIAEIEEFGHGANRGEALDDLGKTIAELYISLTSRREKLSTDLAGVLKSLEEHIIRVRT